jgi:hypothetical protein
MFDIHNFSLFILEVFQLIQPFAAAPEGTGPTTRRRFEAKFCCE